MYKKQTMSDHISVKLKQNIQKKIMKKYERKKN